MKKNLSVIFTIGIFQSLFAQYSVYDFDPVIVTGSLTEQQWSSALRNTTVINRAQIEMGNSQSIDNILESVIGIDCRSQGHGNVQTDVSIRGAGAEQTLILIDGIAVTDPQTAHFSMDLPISNRDIEQVEIIKGGASKIYGAGAYGGVINFITRQNQPSFFEITAHSGSFETFGASAGLFRHTGKFQTRLSSSYQQSEGYRYNTDFKHLNLSLNSVFQNSRRFSKFSIAYLNKDFGANDFYYTDKAEQRESTETLMFSAVHRQSGKTGPFKTSLSWRSHLDHYIYDFTNPALYENRHRTNVVQTTMLKTVYLRNGVFNVSVNSHFEQIHSNNLGNHQRTAAGLAAEYQQSLGKRVNLQIGIADDYYSDWGNAFMPGVDLRIDISDKLVAQSSISRAYRIPSFTELYYSSPTNQGNPDLKPEIGWTAEQNLRYNQGKTTTAIGLFLRSGNEQIDWVRQYSGDQWQVQNISSIENIGLETSFNYSPDNHFLKSLSVNYCTMKTNKTEFEFESKYLLSSLRHQMIISIIPARVFNLQQKWTLRYEDRIHSPAYTIVNASLTRAFKRVSISIGLSNLLDGNYQNAAGIPMPGRRINVNFQYRTP